MDDVLRNALGQLLKAVHELLGVDSGKTMMSDAAKKLKLLAAAKNSFDFNDDDSVRWQAILQLQTGVMQLLEDGAFTILLNVASKSDSMSLLKARMYDDEARREATKLAQRNKSVYLSVNQAWHDLQACVGDMDDSTNAIYVPSHAMQVRRLPF